MPTAGLSNDGLSDQTIPFSSTMYELVGEAMNGRALVDHCQSDLRGPHPQTGHAELDCHFSREFALFLADSDELRIPQNFTC